MLKTTALRTCDHCRKLLKPEQVYIGISCSARIDQPGRYGVMPDSTITIGGLPMPKPTELHQDCVAAFFQTDAWIPSGAKSPERPKKRRARRPKHA